MAHRLGESLRIRVFDETTIVFMCYIKFDKPTVMILASLRRRALVMYEMQTTTLAPGDPSERVAHVARKGGVLRTLELACAAGFTW